MAFRPGSRDQRRAPRVDVLLRVRGRLVTPDTPIVVHDLSRTGFAVLSEVQFKEGQTLDFRLTGEDGAVVNLTAEAIHSRPMPEAPSLFLTGFKFVPGKLTGMVPQALIDQLITAVTQSKFSFF